MDAGLIFGIVYAAGALITMIVYDVHNYKQNKKENAETKFWKYVLESNSTHVGVIWPITLPVLLKEIFSDTYDAHTLKFKTDTKDYHCFLDRKSEKKTKDCSRKTENGKSKKHMARYTEAIKACIDSGLADKILSSEKARTLNALDCLDEEFFAFCTSHCCASDCKSRSDYCPIVDKAKARYGRVGGAACKKVFVQFREEVKE